MAIESVVVATFASVVVYLALIFVNFQAAIGPDSPLSAGWFHSTVGNVSSRYPVPVTPAGYTFSIWGLIYLWNFAWLIYVVTTLCRSNSQGPVFLNPPATTTTFLCTFILNNIANGVWLFLWDREDFGRSLAALVVLAFTLFVALYLSLSSVIRYLAEFKQYAESDLWAYRVLVHNGLAIYAAWAVAANLINLSVTLVYDAKVSSDNATYVSLTTLSVFLIVYFVADLFVFDIYTRYVFMVYPTFIWALAGVMVANGNDVNSPVFIYSGILVGVAFIFFVTKTTFMAIRPPVLAVIKLIQVDKTTYKHMI